MFCSNEPQNSFHFNLPSTAKTTSVTSSEQMNLEWESSHRIYRQFLPEMSSLCWSKRPVSFIIAHSLWLLSRGAEDTTVLYVCLPSPLGMGPWCMSPWAQLWSVSVSPQSAKLLTHSTSYLTRIRNPCSNWTTLLPVRCIQLIRILWPDVSSSKGLDSLSQAVSHKECKKSYFLLWKSKTPSDLKKGGAVTMFPN